MVETDYADWVGVANQWVTPAGRLKCWNALPGMWQCVRWWQCVVRAVVAVCGACGGGSAWAEVAVRACGPKYSVFLFCMGWAYQPASMGPHCT